MVLVFLSLTASANSVIGANSLAAECYAASQAAVINRGSSQVDLDVCNRAITGGNLSPNILVGTYVNRAVILMAMQKPQAALKDLNRALSLNQDTAEAYLNRGNLWFSAGQLEQAIEDYDKAIKLGVSKPNVAYLNRGIALETLGYLTASQRDYSAALKIKPQWSEAQKRLERVSTSIGRELEKRKKRKTQR